MNSKQLLSVVAMIILTSTILISHAIAADDPLKLPPSTTVVILEASNGTQSYFDTKLSAVPAGYDVTNATYLGWCIDQSAEMTRSPATHTVTLYSSLSPPGDLANENWTMVNYILNHKQGEAQDIQEAMWYFINLNSGYSPQSSVAWAMVRHAKANGAGFVPTQTQIAAVIAYPVFITDPSEVQISIIEVTMPSNGSEPTPTPTQTTPTPTPSQTTPTPTPPQTTPTPPPSQTTPTPTSSQTTPGNETLLVIGIILAL